VVHFIILHRVYFGKSIWPAISRDQRWSQALNLAKILNISIIYLYTLDTERRATWRAGEHSGSSIDEANVRQLHRLSKWVN
jgi:hypothetical protein